MNTDEALPVAEFQTDQVLRYGTRSTRCLASQSSQQVRNASRMQLLRIVAGLPSVTSELHGSEASDFLFIKLETDLVSFPISSIKPLGEVAPLSVHNTVTKQTQHSSLLPIFLQTSVSQR